MMDCNCGGYGYGWLMDWIFIIVRVLDLVKDVGLDGYGNVVWKERVESWKLR